MKKKLLSIIIVSYNVKKKLISCCREITDYPNSEIIVIDNNSKDKSYESLCSMFSNKLTLVKNKKNLGFTKAINQGIKMSNGDLILLLNPDTIPNHLAIDKLKKFLLYKKNVGLVGGRMVKPMQKITHGTYVNKPNFLTGIFEFTNLKKIFSNNRFHRSFYYKDENVSTPKLVFGLSGGFLMFEKKLVEKIGYFDEHFFMYLEDIDFGIRARALGYFNYYLPEAVIIHDSGSSSKSSLYKINVDAWRNSRNYYFYKHFNIYQCFALRLLFLLDDMLIDLLHVVQKKTTKINYEHSIH